MTQPNTLTYHSPLLGESYTQIKHKSGMEIWLCPKAVTSSSAHLGVRYGSADFPPQTPHAPLGIAHFLEHKVFEAPKGESFDLFFSEIGAEVNAYTSYDRTVYYVNCTQQFEVALTGLLTMVQSLCVTAKSVAIERGIIAEEIRMNSDSPFESCYANLLMSLYQNHRMREEICGSEASIKRITPQMLRDIFALYYRPDNMILTICGDVTEEQVLSCVDKVFGDFDKDKHSPLPPPTTYHEPATPHKQKNTMQMQVPKPLMSMGCKCHSIPMTNAELFRRDLCMALLCEVLFGRSGELYDQLFEEGVITPTYAYGYAQGRDYGYFALSCECDHPDLVYEKVCAYLEKVRVQGINGEDLERCRRVMYADYVTGFDAPEDMASSLMAYAMDGVGWFDFLEVLPSITIDEVLGIFLENFKASQYALSVVLPRDNPTV